MSTVYRKTAKGLAEIETRAHRLSPRRRSALILVDGRKSDDELALLILAEPQVTLASLLAEGFIEVLATLADRPPERKPTPAAGGRDAQGARLALEGLRRAAVRHLADQLGPAADSLAMRIESAASMPELQALLVQGAQVLRSVRGGAAADFFAARFIGADRE